MNWSTSTRETSLVEHVCKHGTGHPNYYSVVRLHDIDNLYRQEDDPLPLEGSHWFIHGCDGCCSRADFPGHRMYTGTLVIRLENKIKEWWAQEIGDKELRRWMAFTIHDMRINEKYPL